MLFWVHYSEEVAPISAELLWQIPVYFAAFGGRADQSPRLVPTRRALSIQE
jgi:hypothetical protein